MVAIDMSDADDDKWNTFDLYLQMSSNLLHPKPPPRELAFVKAKIPGTQQTIDFTILRHPIVNFENVIHCNPKKMAELQETWTVLLIKDAFQAMKAHERAKARVAKDQGKASDEDNAKSKTSTKEYKEAFWNLAAIVARVCTIQAMELKEPEVLRELTQSLSKLSETLSGEIVAAAWETFDDGDIPHPNEDVQDNWLALYRQGVNEMRERRKKNAGAKTPRQLHAMAQQLGKSLGMTAESFDERLRLPQLRRALM